MEKIRITSKPITTTQIEEAVAKYRSLLETYAPELSAGPVSEVLGQEELADEMFRTLRRRVDRVSTVIIRCLKVNRTRTPSEAIDATGRNKTVDDDIVNAMPRGEGEELGVIFFNVGRRIDDEELEREYEREYEKRGLKLADPYSLAAVNESDPAFADERRIATFWKKESGRRCYAAFDDCGGHQRRVIVFKSQGNWEPDRSKRSRGPNDELSKLPERLMFFVLTCKAVLG